MNTVTRHRLLIAFVAAVSALTAQAAAPLTMKLGMQAQKGHFTEQCFTLESGQQVTYQLSTRHPIEFNLHHHTADGQTLFPDRLVVQSKHSKQIRAESSGAYCFMATNQNNQPGAFDVVITYEIAVK